MNRGVLLKERFRQGKTKIDEDLPISKWVLSDFGIEQANNLSQSGVFNEYEKTTKYCLEHRDESVSNWEPASRALDRFSNKIEELDKEHEDKEILIVGHGYTINMYFAKFLGELEQTYERLGKNTFVDWGIVQNRKIIKDIIGI